MASKDIMSEAVEQADLMQKAAFEHAKNALVEAMSTNLKAAVSEAIEEQLDGDDEVTEDTVVQEDEITEEEEEDMEEMEDMDEEDEDMDETEDMEEGDWEDQEEGEEEDEVDVDIDIDADGDDDDEEEEDDDEMEEEEVVEVVDDEEMEEGEDGDEDVEEVKYESVVRENKKLRKENAEYAKVLRFLKKRINEVNLFNSRLAAATDVMNSTTLTKEQKESVVEAFDGCKSIDEVQRTQKMLSEAYKATTKKVTKVRAERPNVQSVISENVKDSSNDAYNRLAQLAGL